MAVYYAPQDLPQHIATKSGWWRYCVVTKIDGVVVPPDHAVRTEDFSNFQNKTFDVANLKTFEFRFAWIPDGCEKVQMNSQEPHIIIEGKRYELVNTEMVQAYGKIVIGL